MEKSVDSIFPFVFFSNQRVETSPQAASEAMTKLMVPARINAVRPNGKIDVTISFGILPGIHLCLSDVREAVEILILEANDRQLVYFPGKGRVDVETATEKFFCDDRYGLNIASERTRRIEFAAGRSGTGIAIDRTGLVQRLAVLLDRPVTRKLEFTPRFDATTGNYRAVAEMIEALVSPALGAALTASPMTASNLSTTMFDLVLQSLPHNYSHELSMPPARITPRHVKRAMDHIKSRARLGLTVEDVAQACEVSLRSLQYGFRRFLGTTPADFIRETRLHGARQDIIAGAGLSVADIVTVWGFTNRARFNAYFKKAYGETPTELFRRHWQSP